MFANDFFKFDNKLCVDFLGHRLDFPKCDGFVIRYGSEIYTVDAGLPKSPAMIEHLLTLRAQMLDGNPELIEDPSCKLRINCIISHFHVDHVGALTSNVVPNEFISVDNVYVGPATKVSPETYEESPNGDYVHRPHFLKAIETYQPNAKIHEVDFGKENVLKFQS